MQPFNHKVQVIPVFVVYGLLEALNRGGLDARKHEGEFGSVDKMEFFHFKRLKVNKAKRTE